MLVSLFADASYHSGFQAGGWGAWIRSERGRAYQGGAWDFPLPSSAVCEALAICEGLHLGIRNRVLHSNDEVLIQTDCEGILKWFEYNTIKVPERILQGLYPRAREHFRHAMHLARDHRLQLKLRHIKGHQNSSDETRHYVNNMCDRLAKRGGRNAMSTLAAYKDDVRTRIYRRYIFTQDQVKLGKTLPADQDRPPMMLEDDNGKLTIKF